jgi:copper chaperone CopZ
VKKISTLVFVAAVILMLGSFIAFADSDQAPTPAKTCMGHEHAKMSAEECAKICGMSPEEYSKMCADKENCGVTRLSIKGMTCTGCEQTISAALEKVDGVYKVVKIDYKEGMALVCANTAKVSGETLATTVTNKGYAAEIVPAVVTTTEAPAAKTVAGCPPTCPAAKLGCAKDKKTAETKSTDGSK